MNLQIIHHFFLKSKWYRKNTWESNAKLNQNFLTYFLKQAKIRIPQSLYSTRIQEILMSKQKNKESSAITGSNQIMPPSNNVTVSSNALLNAIAANPDNLPVNNKEQTWKPSPVGTQLMESTLKSPSEKNSLLGHYIFTDSPLTKTAASQASSVKSDPLGSTSNRVKKEPFQTSDPFPKEEEASAKADRQAKAHNEIAEENKPFVKTDNIIKTQLLYNSLVKQEAEYDVKSTVQLISEICSNLENFKLQHIKVATRKSHL